MRTTKLIFVVLIAVLALAPLAAQGAAEKIPALQKQGVLPVYTASLVTDDALTLTDDEPILVPGSSLSVPGYASVDRESLESRFSYAYGYMITSSLLSQNVSLEGAYWLKGIIDGYNYFSGSFLIAPEDMESYYNDYINNFYNAGLTSEVGALLSREDLDALTAPDTLVGQFSYSYAMMITVQYYWMNGLDISLDEFLQGSAEALYLDEPQYMTTEEMESAINEYADILNAEYEEYIAALREENLKEAEEFLESYKETEGVVVLPSGDLLEMISSDEEPGAVPSETDTVIVDYELTLLDGTAVDSGEDISFPLTSLIPGFVEAVTYMHVGDEAVVYIHPDYGYGESGASSIEPNSLLIFHITLKGIETAEN